MAALLKSGFFPGCTKGDSVLTTSTGHPEGGFTSTVIKKHPLNKGSCWGSGGGEVVQATMMQSRQSTGGASRGNWKHPEADKAGRGSQLQF